MVAEAPGGRPHHAGGPFVAPRRSWGGPTGHVGSDPDVPGTKITGSGRDNRPAERPQVVVEPAPTRVPAPGPIKPAAAILAGGTVVSDEAVEAAARADHAFGRLGDDPDWDGLTGTDRDSYRRAARSYLTAAAPVIAAYEQARIAAVLRQARDGRLEYATSAPDSTRLVLESEAATLDAAAQVVEGDLDPMFGWLPSWRWTDEMTAQVRRG